MKICKNETDADKNKLKLINDYIRNTLKNIDVSEIDLVTAVTIIEKADKLKEYIDKNFEEFLKQCLTPIL